MFYVRFFECVAAHSDYYGSTNVREFYRKDSRLGVIEESICKYNVLHCLSLGLYTSCNNNIRCPMTLWKLQSKRLFCNLDVGGRMVIAWCTVVFYQASFIPLKLA